MTATLAAPAHSGAVVGPNAIIQIANVLRDRWGRTYANGLVAGSSGYTLDDMPSAMVDERKVQALVQALVADAGAHVATGVLRDAGHRTGAYILHNRIPRFAQVLIARSPRRLGMRLLLSAITKHAWTFAGSGTFRVSYAGRLPSLVFEQCSMCHELHTDRPVCDFYAGTIEYLIRALVAPCARVHETACMAQGAPCCQFEIDAIV